MDLNLSQEQRELSAAFLGSLKAVHSRYVAAIGSSDKDLTARKLVECEGLAVHISGILCEETTAVNLKTVLDGIDYALEDAPAALSFLTSVVIKIAFNLPRANFHEILRYIEAGKQIKNKVEDPSGSWCHYFTFVETLREG